MTAGALGEERPTLFLRKATGLVRGWSVRDSLIYACLATNFVTLGIYEFTFAGPAFPKGQLITATIIGGIWVSFLVVAYTGLVVTIPRAGLLPRIRGKRLRDHAEETRMSELGGRTFLVTGGNTGIGQATAAGLAGRGGRVWIAARSRAKGEAAVAAIKAETGSDSVWFLPLDLADLESVGACASAFLALGEPLHVLVNNAGVGGARGLTRQGFELTFGINHLGHFALTNALLGCLTASAPARVVTVSSDAHYSAQGIDFDALRRRTRGLTGLHEYAISKLCNVLFTQELARRVAGTGVTTYALHPGVVASDIWRRVPWPVRPIVTRRMLSTTEGAQTSLYCATSPDVAQDSGLFYDKCAQRAPSPVATPELAAKLWKRSETWAELL